MVRLVRTMQHEHLNIQELAQLIDENGDGMVSVEELHRGLLKHLGVFLSEQELEALVKHVHGNSDRNDSSVSVHELLDAVELGNFRGHVALGSYLTDANGTRFRVTNLQAVSNGVAGVEVRTKEGKTRFFEWPEAFTTFSCSMVGLRVDHPKRGQGTIIEVIPDDKRSKPYKVAYDNREIPWPFLGSHVSCKLPTAGCSLLDHPR